MASGSALSGRAGEQARTWVGLGKSFKYTSMTAVVGAGIRPCPYWTDEGTEALTDVRGQLEGPRAFLLQLS